MSIGVGEGHDPNGVRKRESEEFRRIVMVGLLLFCPYFLFFRGAATRVFRRIQVCFRSVRQKVERGLDHHVIM